MSADTVCQVRKELNSPRPHILEPKRLEGPQAGEAEPERLGRLGPRRSRRGSLSGSLWLY